MHFSTTRWTTAAAAAALIALPGAAFAQTPTTPQQPAPTQQTTPTPQTTSAQPSAEKPAADAQVGAATAKQHLSEARDTLSQLAAMPEAARLQGDARAQVSQVITNFNELITTQTNWRAAYEKLDANLSSLLGPDGQSATPPATGVPGATGTSGTTPAASSQIDPAIRAKLVEFRTHLKEFEKAAGGATTSTQPAPDAMPPSAATASTTNPADPATSGQPTKTTPPAMVTRPPAGTVGTSGTTSSSPEPTADQAKPATEQTGHAEADKELDAISAILNNSKTGTLTKAQTAQLKKHVEQLRALLSQSK
jgi:hypothetical protein